MRPTWRRLGDQAHECNDGTQLQVDKPAMLQMSLSEAKASLEILQKQEAASLNLQNLRLWMRRNCIRSSILGNIQVLQSFRESEAAFYL